MPPVGSRYTFADFLQRLERSPAAHMSPLYHEHRLLFVHRPDMLSRAVLSISWERGLALLQAAYYTQPVAAETYRAMLARMLRHNRHVERMGAGQLVSWQAAMRVMNEAVVTHGTSLPTRVTVSTLRLLAPHRQWRTAIDILKLSQTNGQLTKPMLLDAAHACATPAAWPHALRLLMHLHAQDPPLLHDAIQSMRPLGSTALTSLNGAHALLPASTESDGSSSSAGPSPGQQHVLDVLNSVVSTVPYAVAMRDPLCTSYLTHLLASTTLSPELKVQRATTAMAQLPWAAALQLLSDVSEPAVLTDTEWQRVRSTVLMGSGQEDATQSTRRRRGLAGAAGKGKRKGLKKAKKTRAALEAKEDGEGEAAGEMERTEEDPQHADAADQKEQNTPPGSAAAAITLTTTTALFSRLQLLRASPLTSAAMIAVLVDKMPTPEMAVSFIRSCAAQLSQPDALSDEAASAASSSLSSEAGVQGGVKAALPLSAANPVGSAAATRHPVVVHALLRNCARHDGGWSVAAHVLLEHSGAQVATPTELLSALAHKLRQAKQVSLVVRLLHEHIIPSASSLTASAWEDVLECVLAHNRALQVRAAAAAAAADAKAATQGDSRPHEGRKLWSPPTSTSAGLPRLSGVHWVSALSWVLDRQAATREARIQKTGTGPSIGAPARHPTAHVALEMPLTPRMLSLLINICVQGGSPQGALHAMGYARRVDKTELPHTAQIRAMLYCMQYDRPLEAEAIVAHLSEREGEEAAQPLQHLLRLMRESKHREEAGSQ